MEKRKEKKRKQRSKREPWGSCCQLQSTVPRRPEKPNSAQHKTDPEAIPNSGAARDTATLHPKLPGCALCNLWSREKRTALPSRSLGERHNQGSQPRRSEQPAWPQGHTRPSLHLSRRLRTQENAVGQLFWVPETNIKIKLIRCKLEKQEARNHLSTLELGNWWSKLTFTQWIMQLKFHFQRITQEN